MSKPKEYNLNIQDLLQIPEDRFDDFLVDLKKWHKSVRLMVKMLEDTADAVGEPMSPQLFKMNWIDDGKHDGKIIITQAKEQRKDRYDY